MLPVYDAMLAGSVQAPADRALHKGQPGFKGQPPQCQTRKSLWFKQQRDVLSMKEDTICHCHLSNHLMFLKKTTMCKNQRKNYFWNTYDFVLFVTWIPLLVIKIQHY